jgi:CheY-like chemotaxis protein
VAERPAAPALPVAGGHVLVVDDEPFVRTGIERALARRGCEVTDCESPLPSPRRAA